MTHTPTIEEIQAMTSEEVAQLNKKLSRQIAKQMLRKITVTAAVVVGVHFAVKALENHAAENGSETPTIEA